MDGEWGRSPRGRGDASRPGTCHHGERPGDLSRARGGPRRGPPLLAATRALDIGELPHRAPGPRLHHGAAHAGVAAQPGLRPRHPHGDDRAGLPGARPAQRTFRLGPALVAVGAAAASANPIIAVAREELTALGALARPGDVGVDAHGRGPSGGGARRPVPVARPSPVARPRPVGRPSPVARATTRRPAATHPPGMQPTGPAPR